MKLYNTATRNIEEFTPLEDKKVTLYTCGPTVYDYTHIGHLRTYTNNDLLRRTLSYLGYTVNHVMNITDVGHLTGDDDNGDDKLEKKAEKENKKVEDVANFYTIHFFDSTDKLNILPPNTIAKAMENIPAMIDLIKQLEQKGFVYKTNEAVYFDTDKFDRYGALSGQRLEEKQTSRQEVHTDPDKKNKADFALWFFLTGHHQNHQLHWSSPWGEGFPGWHIECSAMAIKYLGETIDIHAGGVDHIPVHHENEIAQSECATGKPFVKYWLHSEFVLIEGEKMSKSKGNFITVDDIIKKGYNPLSLRYLYLQTHYRKELNFTWESITSATTALKKLNSAVIQLKNAPQRPETSNEKLAKVRDYQQQFTQALGNDLQIPKALSIVWDTLKSNIPSGDKLDLVSEFDHVLGLKLSEIEEIEIPQAIEKLKDERDAMRKAEDYLKADELRKKAESQGYTFKDTATGTITQKVNK